MNKTGETDLKRWDKMLKNCKLFVKETVEENKFNNKEITKVE